VQHSRDAIEDGFAVSDIGRTDVAPRDRHAECSARLGVGAGGGEEARDSVAALAVVTFGDVEHDGRERSADLIAEVAIEAPDRRNDGPELLDGSDGEIEDDEL
jgi:hypothetical protein